MEAATGLMTQVDGEKQAGDAILSAFSPFPVYLDRDRLKTEVRTFQGAVRHRRVNVIKLCTRRCARSLAGQVGQVGHRSRPSR